VTLRLGTHPFAPTLVATILTLVSVAVFVRLGFWQLSRAAEKQALHARYSAGQQSVLELTPETARTVSRYQRISARGHYDGSQQILLDNMPSVMGQPGYRVVTPFEIGPGAWILVDRGWHPMGKTRADLPDVAVPDTPRMITGQMDALPKPGVRMGDAAAANSQTWPRVMHFPEAAAIAAALDRNILPGLVLLDPDQPDGYERVWRARAETSMDPQQHYGYAVQWFAFAIVGVVLYVVFGLRRGRLR
jgi:surfeit locus 1 family protein